MKIEELFFGWVFLFIKSKIFLSHSGIKYKNGTVYRVYVCHLQLAFGALVVEWWKCWKVLGQKLNPLHWVLGLNSPE